ncbi:NfeD family protein [Adhaeribacter terreus]|uniref:NfeD family protein n=1 Tax=Adhaeribacter terreus TaxID=529703 RepID=A0ABW0ECD1_9BACT
MDWITIVSLLVFGILLLVVEIILVPGTTVVGLAGIILMTIGVWLGFRDLGLVYGYWLLGVSVVITFLFVYIGLKKQTWQKFTLTTVNKGRVNEDNQLEVKIGEVGKTLSSLRPSGTGFFHETQIEVTTTGEFIPTGTSIRIVKVEPNKITVERAEQHA